MGTKIKCLKCNDVIESLHRHDFKWCSCKNIFVDGGGDYCRTGGKALEDGSYLIWTGDRWKGSFSGKDELAEGVSSCTKIVIERNKIEDPMSIMIKDISDLNFESWNLYCYHPSKGLCTSKIERIQFLGERSVYKYSIESDCRNKISETEDYLIATPQLKVITTEGKSISMCNIGSNKFVAIERNIHKLKPKLCIAQNYFNFKYYKEPVYSIKVAEGAYFCADGYFVRGY